MSKLLSKAQKGKVKPSTVSKNRTHKDPEGPKLTRTSKVQ